MQSIQDRAAAEVARIKQHLRPLRKVYPHLAIFATRHGKVMIYYRWGERSIQIKSHPVKDAATFHLDYCAASDGKTIERGTTKQNPGSHAEGTWNAALDLLVGSLEYTGKAASTKRGYNAAVEMIRKAWGPIPISKAEPYHVEEMIEGLRARGLSGNDQLTIIRKVAKIARRRGWLKIDLIGDDLHRERQKNADGWRPWTLREIDTWRTVYPIGSTPRLAFELIYNHALARSDVVRLAPSHIAADGTVTIARRKTGAVQNSTVDNADLLACLALLPPPASSEPVDLLGRSTVPYLRTTKGVPFAPDYFAWQWRKWADDAGLPKDFVIHGGRKSFAVDAVDNEVAELDAMRVMGQSTSEVFRHYAKKANGARGGARASAKVSAVRANRAA